MKKSKTQFFQYILNFLLIGLLGLAEELIRREFVPNHAVLATLVAIAILHIIGLNILFNINNKIEDVAQPVKTTLLDAKEAYDRATEAVLSARREVLAVHNWASEEYQPSKNADPSRKNYFAAILETAIRNRLKYKRILQVPSGTVISTNEVLRSHLITSAEQTQQTHYRIQVRRCEPLYLVNFLLAPDKH